MDNHYQPRPTGARQRRVALRAAKQRKVILAIAVCFALILLMFLILIVGNIIALFAEPAPPDSESDIPGTHEPEDPQPTDPDDTLPPVDPNTTYLSLTAEQLRRGDLILVNTTHEYIFPTINQNLINVYDSQVLSKTLGNYFQLPSSSLLMDKTAYNALDKMMQAFYAQTGIPNVIVSSAYRTYAQQSALYDEFQAGTGAPANPPGTSSHEDGTAVDLATREMRSVVDQIGPDYGWSKVHAPGEWWHVDYVGG
jgi:LAS superfamily LD-carboxypeptidase LdcB